MDYTGSVQKSWAARPMKSSDSSNEGDIPDNNNNINNNNIDNNTNNNINIVNEHHRQQSEDEKTEPRQIVEEEYETRTVRSVEDGNLNDDKNNEEPENKTCCQKTRYWLTERDGVWHIIFVGAFIGVSIWFFAWGGLYIRDSTIKLAGLHLVLAALFGLFMAFNIGGNDVANSFGTSVGAGTLTLKQALLVASVFEVSGAILAGGEVTSTIRSGIVNLGGVKDFIDPQQFMFLMMSSLLAAATWLMVASWRGWPVSTTHAIVGGIVGAAITTAHIGAFKPDVSPWSIIDWMKIAMIAVSWVTSPLLGGIVSGVIYFLIKYFVLRYNECAEEKLLALEEDRMRIIEMHHIEFMKKSEDEKIAETAAIARDTVLMHHGARKVIVDLPQSELADYVAANKAKVKPTAAGTQSVSSTTVTTTAAAHNHNNTNTEPIADNNNNNTITSNNNDEEMTETAVVPVAGRNRSGRVSRTHSTTAQVLDMAHPRCVTQFESDYLRKLNELKERSQNIQSHAALETWIPLLAAITAAALSALLLTKGLKNLDLGLTPSARVLLILVITGAAWLGAYIYTRSFREEPVAWATYNVFRVMQVVTASSFAFSHGSNDIANAIAPFAAVLDVLKDGKISTKSATPTPVLATFGVALVVGLWFMGRPVMATVGEKLTKMHPSSGFTAELSSAVVTIMASILGLPVSSTHISIGAVLGIGVVNRTTNWKLMIPVAVAWVTTVPISAGLSALFFVILFHIF